MNETNNNDNRWYPQFPRVAVHPLVFKDEQLLLIKRAKEPHKGKWSLPGGRIELGETVYEAAKREVFEECHIEIEIERLHDIGEIIITDSEARISYHFVLIYPLAKYKAGKIEARSDAEDVNWFALAEIAELDIHPQLQSVLDRVK